MDLSTYEARHKEVRVAPELASCPRCGEECPRHEVRTQSFWEADLQQTTIADVSFGRYMCPGCPEEERWFTTIPAPYRTQGQYSLPAKQTVLELVKRSKLPLDAAAQTTREFLHLPMLNETTLLEWFRDAGDAVDHDHQCAEG